VLLILIAQSISPPQVVEAASRLRAMIAQPPAAAADRAFAAGDRRLWATEGLGYEVHGTHYSNFRPQPQGACGVKMLPLLSDVVFAESVPLFRPAQRWAAAYNYRMVVRSRCLPAPPEAGSRASRAEVAELRRLLDLDPVREAERAVAAGEKRLWTRHGGSEPIGHLDVGSRRPVASGGELCQLRPMPALRPVFPVEVHDLGRASATYDWPRAYNMRVLALTGCTLPPREPSRPASAQESRPPQH
jgi:hypothetical protein